MPCGYAPGTTKSDSTVADGCALGASRVPHAGSGKPISSAEPERPCGGNATGWMVVLALIGLLALPAGGRTAESQQSKESPPDVGSHAQPSGQRFGSLKSDRVDVRSGPGTEHPIVWVYSRAGFPLEVLAESAGWSHVRDLEGMSGWVSQGLVSNRRTAIVRADTARSPSDTASLIALRTDDSSSAPAVAMVEAGVIADVRSCSGRWCLVSVGQYRGWIEQVKLWGIADGELIR